MPNDELINDTTQAEINANSEVLEELQLSINESLSSAINDLENSNKSVLIDTIKKEIENVVILRIGSEELEQLSVDRIAKLKKFTDGTGAFVYQSEDFFKLFDDELKMQLNNLINSAVKTYDDYKNLFEKGVSDFISNPPSNIDFNDLDELRKQAKAIVQNDLTGKFISQDDVTYFINNNGRRERAQYWYDRNIRSYYTREADERRRKDMATYGWDLVRVSAHADCSELCAPYQGKIFSEFGQNKNYPTLQSAIKGGLRHYNCRHGIYEYFQGESETTKELYGNDLPPKISAKERKELYNQRQLGKYYKRQAVLNNDKYLRAKKMGLDDKAKIYRNKRIDFNKRANELLN